MELNKIFLLNSLLLLNKTMEIASKYDPSEVEKKWYEYWLNNQLFKSEPDGREPYTVVIPPPNVTGVLHMGHMLNNTIQECMLGSWNRPRINCNRGKSCEKIGRARH